MLRTPRLLVQRALAQRVLAERESAHEHTHDLPQGIDSYFGRRSLTA